MISFVLLLWLLTVLCLYRYTRISCGELSILFSQSFTQLKVKPVPTNIFVKIASFQFFTTPGWIIKKITNHSKVLLLIQQSGIMITSLEYCQFKQFIFSLSSFILLGYIFFGNITKGNLLYLLFIIIFSYFSLDIWLKIKKEKRIEIFRKEISYFIDIVALTLETGMNIEQALVYINQNGKTSLAQLFKKHLKTIDMGKSLEEVLCTIKKNVPVLEFENFVSSVLQAKKLGVSLAETLKIQSDLIRTQRRQQAEELGRTAAVKISIPLVFFIFPALLIIYIGPGILRLMNESA